MSEDSFDIEVSSDAYGKLLSKAIRKGISVSKLIEFYSQSRKGKTMNEKEKAGIGFMLVAIFAHATAAALDPTPFRFLMQVIALLVFLAGYAIFRFASVDNDQE